MRSESRVRIRELLVEPRPSRHLQTWRIGEPDPVPWSHWHRVLVLIPNTETESCADNNWKKGPRLADVWVEGARVADCTGPQLGYDTNGDKVDDYLWYKVKESVNYVLYLGDSVKYHERDRDDRLKPALAQEAGIVAANHTVYDTVMALGGREQFLVISDYKEFMADLTTLKNNLRQDLATLRQDIDRIFFPGNNPPLHQDVTASLEDLIEDWKTPISEKVTESFWKSEESALELLYAESDLESTEWETQQEMG